MGKRLKALKFKRPQLWKLAIHTTADTSEVVNIIAISKAKAIECTKEIYGNDIDIGGIKHIGAVHGIQDGLEWDL